MVRYESMSFTVSSNKSDFKYDQYPPITLDEDGTHELALLNIDMYHSVPNIDESKNKFVYYYDNIKYEIEFPTGAYEIKAINDYIQEQLVKDGNKEAFSIKANPITLKCIIRINKSNILIHFNHDKSLKNILGFGEDSIEGIGEHEGEQIVNILSVNTILVNCNIIEGSYINGVQKPVLYSFFPDVPPGYKINEKPSTAVYLPVTIPRINSIHVWLTDQNHRPLNVREEEITIRLHLKSTYHV
jgi:hypothetical protein